MSKNVIKLGNIYLGGDNPIRVQSMCNTDTRNIENTINQILQLEEAGCEIIRVAVPDDKAAKAIKKIKDKINIPLVADIHFDYKLALLSLDSGADCVRINPGNLGSNEKVKIVVDTAKGVNAAIRIGVNAGSLERELIKQYGVTAESLTLSAVKAIKVIEGYGFTNFKVSVKASSVPMTIQAYRKLYTISDYPLHIGVTEAGTIFSGTIKSSIGIGTLLADKIGDTLRVSLTGDPINEVKTAWSILSALEIRKRGVNIISCPTCGRTEIDLVTLAKKVEDKLISSLSDITIAVMGCSVNGPGEAREADYGIAGGKGLGIIFKKGKVIKKVQENELLKEFFYILEQDNII